jgi:phospholipase/carboxylesterase
VSELVHRLRPAAGEPEGALVLMHGRAVDENDLFPLLDLLDPQRRLLAVTPGGPFSFPPGGRHWYAIRSVGYPEPASFAEGFGALGSFLDGLGLDWSRTVVGGFSQGGVMAYALALGAGRPLPAGVIALSSFIPTVDNWSVREDLPAGFPVAIGHGSRDPIISVDFARSARDRLNELGADVTYHESEIPHTIDPRFLGSLPGWVERVIP